MRLVPLGDTGILVSRMCFGALTVGPLQAKLPPRQGAEVLARAIEGGVNFVDTAQLYGTYPVIRHAMEHTGRRDLVVATKTYAYSRRLAAEAVEQARRELDRDYIDLFLLHEQESIHTLRGHREALEYLWEQKQRGVIRAVGASMHHVAAVEGAVAMGLDVVHPLLNVAGLGIVDGARQDMERAVARARERGIGVYMMKPLGGGNLFRRAGECLDYALNLPYVDSIAIGMQSAEEVEANLRYWQCGQFTQRQAASLAAKTRRLHIEEWCEGCEKCVGICGQAALRTENGRALCDHTRCVLCGYCSAVCPAWAIKVV